MKHLFQFSLFLLALLLPATALAHDFEVDGIYYNINGNEATVTYKGTSYSGAYSGSVTIPATVTYDGTTYPVTSIGNEAFALCYNLTSITIPNSVTAINDCAFLNCSGLTSVTIPGSVTLIGEYAFETCVSLTSVDIPYSVSAIGDFAFAECSGLTSITIPNSVTSIGVGAFYECTGLTSIDIPNSVTAISDGTFIRCFCLTSISIPNSVTSIGNGAFYSCSGLTSISIPNSVTSIGGSAFYNCTGLTSVTIPNSVTSIGVDAFSYCSGLTIVSIGNSVTSIGDRAFYECTGLTSIDIPNSVTAIGEDAFSSTAWYNNHPDGLVYAGLVAYKYKGLMPSDMSIFLYDGTLGIAGSAFSGCAGLTSINIPNSILIIGDNAFASCNHLTEIYSLALVPPTVYANTFNGCYSAILNVYYNVMNAYKTADYWKNFTNIVGIVECVGVFEVDGILYRAMNDGTAAVIANEGIENYYIGDLVIADTVTFEGNNYVVKIIEDNAFSDCYELTSITIPNSVTDIGEQAFQGCTGLTNVTIGGVTDIGAKAFNYCNALETVKCMGTVPPVMASADCFSAAAYNRATLLVPRNTEATYSATDYWYKFAHIDGWGSAGQGDVNGDGVMSIRDVTSLIDVLLGHELDSFYFDSADLNSNGRLDIGDVTSLIDNLLNGDY